MGLEMGEHVGPAIGRPRVEVAGVELVNVSTTYDPYPWQLLDQAWRIIRHVRGEAAEQAAYNRLLEKRISDLGLALEDRDAQIAELLGNE